jgi:hypothetical protein
MKYLDTAISPWSSGMTSLFQSEDPGSIPGGEKN